MTIGIVVIVALWLVVLAPSLPDLLRRVTGNRFSRFSSSTESILSNKVAYLPGVADDSASGETLSLLVGMGTSRAFQREWARRRRRNVLWTFTGMSVVSLLVLVIFGPVAPASFSAGLLAAHVVSDVLLGAYVISLARRQRRIQERRVQVTAVRRPAQPAAGSFQPRVEPIRLASSAGVRR